MAPAQNAPLWLRAILPLAAVKLAAGLGAFFWVLRRGPVDSPDFNYAYCLVYMLCFGSAAALLLTGGRSDRRAVTLGGLFLVIASVYANRPLHLTWPTAAPLWQGLLEGIDALELDSFMPVFLWSFVRAFPEATLPPAGRRALDLGVKSSLGVGLVLFLANLGYFLLGSPETGLLAELAGLVPLKGGGRYYSVLIPLTVAALPFLVWKARLARGTEHRRARLFIAAFVAGLAPILFEALLQVSVSGYSSWQSPVRSWYKTGAHLMAWTVTCATTYSVLVHRVLDVKLIARKALHYALARFSTILLAAVPFAALCASLYVHRDQPVRSLFTGSRLLLLASATVLGVAALRYRSRLLDAIDRRFFREQFDARQILTRLLQRIRGTHEVKDIAELLCRGIDQALHLEGIALLIEDRRSGTLADPRSRTRRLDGSSPLAQLISNASDPLSVDLEDPRSPVGGLPQGDRHWLLDSGFQLIVPIVARDGSLLGLIGLGEKRSGLPFLKEDRKLLCDIANSAALGLELELKHTWGPARRREDDALAGLPPPDLPAPAVENAKECASCGTLYLPYTVFCGTCSRRLELSIVPYVLPGKFRFERRIGLGGMGVVYRGSDLTLARPVAVKTLRRVSPEDAMRLRREARTAAAVAHPHLASIYGVETWRGTPMLVMEFLEGGTLAQRIEKGPLDPLEAVELGIAMAGALEHLHAADILHRDVKPSNIGYTRDGVPKLMDFGIARFMLDPRREHGFSTRDAEEEGTSILPPTSLWDQTPTSITLTKQLVGTISYLSPEALAGRPANASFDLWSLSLVLYECLLGRKVFSGADAKQTMTRIRQGRIPDLEQACPGTDPALGELFRSALHRTAARRPASARELRKRLEGVRERLLPGEGLPHPVA